MGLGPMFLTNSKKSCINTSRSWRHTRTSTSKITRFSASIANSICNSWKTWKSKGSDSNASIIFTTNTLTPGNPCLKWARHYCMREGSYASISKKSRTSSLWCRKSTKRLRVISTKMRKRRRNRNRKTTYRSWNLWMIQNHNTQT